MENTVTEAALQKRIQDLEAKQARELTELKAQFKLTYESLQPINLIKSTIHDVVKAPEVQDDLLNAAISLAAGYLAKKITFGDTENETKKLLGDLLQLGVTTAVSRHPDEIKEGLKKLASLALSLQQSVATVKIPDEQAARKQIMKEIMQLTEFIQSAHPGVNKILAEIPLPVAGPDNMISIASLQTYRDSLKLQLVQFEATTTNA